METQRYEISFDKENKIIIYEHRGLLDLEEIKQAWALLMETKEFKKYGYNLLSDYSDADFSFSVNKINDIWNFFFSIKDKINGKKGAIIATKPLITALSVLLEKDATKDFNYEIKTFSTRPAAIYWLSN